MSSTDEDDDGDGELGESSNNDIGSAPPPSKRQRRSGEKRAELGAGRKKSFWKAVDEWLKELVNVLGTNTGSQQWQRYSL